MSAPADDALLMLKAGGLVAAVAVPVAAVAALRRRDRVCPRWRVIPVTWDGPLIFVFFIGYYLGLTALVSALERVGFFHVAYPNGIPAPQSPEHAARAASHLKQMWAGILFLPAFLLAAGVVHVAVYRRTIRPDEEARRLQQTIVFGVVGWLTVGWLSYGVNLLAQAVMQAGGQTPDDHPLVQLGWRGDGYGGAVFVLSACVVAPVLEEFLFRGLLVPWAGGRWYRPWILLAAAAGLSSTAGNWTPAALGFVAALGVVQLLIQRFSSILPKRTVLAIWSSSVLFAAAHSTVWPTPIPLFVLGLGLGYLAARTRSWAAPAACHVLFNATSFVFLVLRG
jgi:membrane protease YdiL (CAAX protease family)